MSRCALNMTEIEYFYESQIILWKQKYRLISTASPATPSSASDTFNPPPSPTEPRAQLILAPTAILSSFNYTIRVLPSPAPEPFLGFRMTFGMELTLVAWVLWKFQRRSETTTWDNHSFPYSCFWLNVDLVVQNGSFRSEGSPRRQWAC